MSRTKGSTNMRSRSIKEVLLQRGIDPLEIMAVVMDEATEPKLKLDAAAKLAPYLYPTLKAIELSGKDGEAIQILSRLIVLPAKETNDWEGIKKD